jgi:hypothetical protein
MGLPNVGVVNYLIKQKTVDEIINHTQIPFGWYPFWTNSINPSEMI